MFPLHTDSFAGVSIDQAKKSTRIFQIDFTQAAGNMA